MTSFVELSSIQKKAKCTWTVSTDAYQTNLQNSPLFSPANDGSVKFFLRLSANATHFSICLCLKKHSRDLNVHYRISLLDSFGNKRNSNEGFAHFSSSFSPSNSEANEGWEFKFSKSSLPLLSQMSYTTGQWQMKILCEVFVLANRNERIIDTSEYVSSLVTSALAKIENPVLDDYEALLRSSELSDAVLVVGQKEFAVHRNILAARSPVFSGMFRCDLEESKNGRVVINDLRVDVCELMLIYIYTGKVPSTKGNSLEFELLIAADKYQLNHLKITCEKSLIKGLSIRTVASSLLLADMHNADLLKKKCVDFITRNSERVMATKGWTDIIKTRPDLIMELYKDLSAKANSHYKM